MQTLVLFLVLLLLAALALLVLALLLPVRIWLTIDTSATRTFAILIQPFGRFGPKVPVTAKTRKRPKPKKQKRRFALPKARIRWDDVKRLIAGLFGAVHLDEARLDAEFGLNDPADTGQAFGLLTPLLYGGAGIPRVFVTLRPVFDRACFSGSGHMRLRITPVDILWPLVRFGWTVFGPAR